MTNLSSSARLRCEMFRNCFSSSLVDDVDPQLATARAETNAPKKRSINLGNLKECPTVQHNNAMAYVWNFGVLNMPRLVPRVVT